MCLSAQRLLLSPGRPLGVSPRRYLRSWSLGDNVGVQTWGAIKHSRGRRGQGLWGRLKRRVQRDKKSGVTAGHKFSFGIKG